MKERSHEITRSLYHSSQNIQPHSMKSHTHTHTPDKNNKNNTNMMFRALTRGVVRSTSRRAGFAGFTATESAVPHSKKDELRTMVADIAKRKDSAQALQAPSEIDWKSYEDMIGADEVAKIKKEFESFKYTDFEQNVSKEKAEMEAKFADVKAQLQAQQDELAQFSQDAEAQLEETSLNYTTEDTTLEEVLQRYPDLDAKYDRQIENHDWDTDDVESVDINAKRVAIMEERYDASLHDGKKFDESVQKEVYIYIFFFSKLQERE